MQPVLEFLQNIRQGAFLEEVYEALALALDAEQRTGKRAEVALKFDFSPAATGDTLPVFVHCTVATKLPAVEHGNTIFFATKDGALLSRRDPRQQELLGLRDVSQPARPASTDIAVGGER